MAKIPFSKLNLKFNNDINIINVNECNIEIRKRLTLKEKTELIANIINNAVDDKGFYNPMKVKMYIVLETVYAYTNLTFTPKMKEDPQKLYDCLTSENFFTNIINNLDENEWTSIQEDVWSTIKNIYDYRNSAAGILEIISTDYSNLQLDASQITDTLLNPENLNTLKTIAPLV